MAPDQAPKSPMLLTVRRGSGDEWLVTLDPEGVAALLRAVARPRPARYDEMRVNHPNAFRRWSTEDDARLGEAFGKGTPVEDLARMFGRHKGAIRARLVKYGLVEIRPRRNP